MKERPYSRPMSIDGAVAVEISLHQRCSPFLSTKYLKPIVFPKTDDRFEVSLCETCPTGNEMKLYEKITKSETTSLDKKHGNKIVPKLQFPSVK